MVILVKVAGVAMVLAALAAPAQAQDWRQNHPRRAEVNGRLNHQDRRIQQGVRNGTLNRGQARQLHQEDRSIRKEERQDAAANGGRITRQQQRQLNHQENSVNRQIYRQKHP